MRKRNSSCATDGVNSAVGSRHGPRSIAVTLRPASHNSWARIDPVHPSPMITASFAGNFFAMPPPFAPTALTSPVRVILDGDRGERDRLVVPVHPFAIVVMGSWEADHLPCRHVLVASIDWVGKESCLGVVEDLLEKILPAALC